MALVRCALLAATVPVALAQMPSSASTEPHLRNPEWRRDLRRAKLKVPRGTFQGEDAHSAAEVLNAHVQKTAGLSVSTCEALGIVGARRALERMFAQAEPQLLDVYESSSDVRRRTVASIASLRAQWSATDILGQVDPDVLGPVIRDGLCHEAVMWFAHHVSVEGRRALVENREFVLPLLPPHLHAQNMSRLSKNVHGLDAHAEVYAEYDQKVSCQQCHIGPINAALFDPDASLPAPLPADEEDPGLERLRVCDFQYSPACGPCEGLGGRRWGDGVHEFDPLPCEVVELPENVPLSQRVPPVYPEMATASFAGEARSPLAVRINSSEPPGRYPSNNAQVYLGWDGEVARMRYEFKHDDGSAGASQIYLQTYDQMREMTETGATATIAGPDCFCEASIAGIMHVGSFAPHEEFDPLDLPAEEGGSMYLGRVRVPAEDGAVDGVVVADHYMKWAFHFLIDAGSGPSAGLPVRLYGPYGVRQVFSDWQLGDPTIGRPDVWTIPKGCVIRDEKACRQFIADPAPAKQSSLMTIVIAIVVIGALVGAFLVFICRHRCFKDRQESAVASMGQSLQPAGDGPDGDGS